MAARKYHPLDRNGNIFIILPGVSGVGAEIQFQSPSSFSQRSMLSRQQKIDQSEEEYFQQLARHLTTSTLHTSPLSGEPCCNTRGAWGA